MHLRNLGKTGIKASSFCLGVMMLGRWGNTDHAECIRIIDASLDVGINIIDIAGVYSRGEPEVIVSQAIKGRHDRLVVTTKAHAPMCTRCTALTLAQTLLRPCRCFPILYTGKVCTIAVSSRHIRSSCAAAGTRTEREVRL